MGIFYHQFTAVGAAAQPMHAEAVQLATACAQHFAMIAAWHIGIGNGSCRAAVAVNSPFIQRLLGNLLEQCMEILNWRSKVLLWAWGGCAGRTC